MRAEKAFLVEVNQMVGVFGNPNFPLLGNLRQETLHRTPGLERSHEYQPGLAAFEKIS